MSYLSFWLANPLWLLVLITITWKFTVFYRCIRMVCEKILPIDNGTRRSKINFAVGVVLDDTLDAKASAPSESRIYKIVIVGSYLIESTRWIIWIKQEPYWWIITLEIYFHHIMNIPYKLVCQLNLILNWYCFPNNIAFCTVQNYKRYVLLTTRMTNLLILWIMKYAFKPLRWSTWNCDKGN